MLSLLYPHFHYLSISLFVERSKICHFYLSFLARKVVCLAYCLRADISIFKQCSEIAVITFTGT